MAVETDADRAVFLDADDFGVAAVWTPLAGGPVTVSGLYDDDFVNLLASGEFGQSGSQPQLLVRASDKPANAAHGDTIVIDGDAFFVAEFQPDGTGMVRVMLGVPD